MKTSMAPVLLLLGAVSAVAAYNNVTVASHGEACSGIRSLVSLADGDGP
jgi:hypothetical protein